MKHKFGDVINSVITKIYVAMYFLGWVGREGEGI